MAKGNLLMDHYGNVIATFVHGVDVDEVTELALRCQRYEEIANKMRDTIDEMTTDEDTY